MKVFFITYYRAEPGTPRHYNVLTSQKPTDWLSYQMPGVVIFWWREIELSEAEITSLREVGVLVDDL